MTSHPLSLANSPRVPRSLDALRARQQAPETPETPVVDTVLVATLADAVRTLQQTVEAQGRELARWKRRVTDLEAREEL